MQYNVFVGLVWLGSELDLDRIDFGLRQVDVKNFRLDFSLNIELYIFFRSSLDISVV